MNYNIDGSTKQSVNERLIAMLNYVNKKEPLK